MKTISIFSLLVFINLNLFSQNEKYYSNEEIKSDLDFLFKALKETHYNPNEFIKPEAFDSIYHQLKYDIKEDSLSILEIINRFQFLTSAVQNGHTAIEFPIPQYLEYAKGGGTVLPIEIAFQDQRPLIRKNWSDMNIEIGSELVGINGKKIEEILEKIYPHISAESKYFKQAKLELFSLPRYYWQIYGKVDEFSIEIKYEGQLKTHKVKAINAIEDYEMKRNPIIDGERFFKFYDYAAYLKPGNFDGELSKFKAFIDSAFLEINKANKPNIIIDFRNNAGGNDSHSDYLVSYIADEDFKWNSSFSLKSSQILKDYILENQDTSTSKFYKSVFDHENGSIYEYQFDSYKTQEIEKRYKGNVYLLVNRQSHSQSTVAAAQIQDYGWATIVGEETAEYPTLYASIFPFTLPNTGITVNISKGKIVRVNGSEKHEGVMPDIRIKDYLLDEHDEILLELLKRFKHSNK
ncbi:S41 family peptidase [Marivirga arenosa]|uniref:S41 family peptidase n=1 Tax=Marivirga arenosa TaxID=3059076 RepID=A0AA51ZX95_9BACT|nr:S41 family peptidase [Marivirga sp. BKB1-2]WNB18439.1 S41 family peptidase [Marivirga sp. BKB1-2]